MSPRVSQITYVSDFILRLRFADGVEGVVELRDELWGPVFEPLKDPATFRSCKVHPELHTIVWENGADVSPEFLYEQLHARAKPRQ